MKAYSAYKASGLEWLGQIPTHWETTKLKWVVKEKLQYGANEATELDDQTLPRYIRITDFGEDGKLKQDTFRSLPYDKAKEYLLNEGDILFARSGATVGKTFQFKNYDGIACFAGYLIKAIPDEQQILSDFLYLFTKSNSYENWRNSIFIQATIQNIGADKYNLLPIPLPSLLEQRAIAAYLDHKTRLIDTYIAKKQQQVERLQAYRAALINQAVTKGLNPDAPMKASGIEWLGDIPAHWEVKKLKHLGTIVLGKMLTPEDKGGYYKKLYLRAKNILWEKVDVSDVKEMWFSEQELKKYRLHLHDILISEGGEVGRTGIWRNEIEECYIQNSVHKVTINRGYNPFYFLYLFLVYGKVGHFDAIVERVSIGHLTREKLTEVFCLVPPPSEQHSIVAYLDEQTAKIDTLAAATQRQLERLQAYRTALISDVVTGKLDVRGELMDNQ
ncbi:restriction endonuclease S subunit [Candidatus Vecturithrix granuli]|uniref:Restriction endonuclease S subunit n=1 Tax=Vecturithrix granuli TaxID=1499967 RepID=A0A081C8B3_VECG1|nr:restriction endonuclease S subunit [Candidatus Vecturithrix granuli]